MGPALCVALRDGGVAPVRRSGHGIVVGEGTGLGGGNVNMRNLCLLNDTRCVGFSTVGVTLPAPAAIVFAARARDAKESIARDLAWEEGNRAPRPVVSTTGTSGAKQRDVENGAAAS